MQFLHNLWPWGPFGGPGPGVMVKLGLRKLNENNAEGTWHTGQPWPIARTLFGAGLMSCGLVLCPVAVSSGL